MLVVSSLAARVVIQLLGQEWENWPMIEWPRLQLVCHWFGKRQLMQPLPILYSDKLAIYFCGWYQPIFTQATAHYLLQFITTLVFNLYLDNHNFGFHFCFIAQIARKQCKNVNPLICNLSFISVVDFRFIYSVRGRNLKFNPTLK